MSQTCRTENLKSIQPPAQNPSQTNCYPPYMEAGFYMLELIKAALKNEAPKQKPEQVSWQSVRKMAGLCSLSGLAYYGLLKSLNKPDKEFMKSWKRDLLQTVTRQTRLDADRARLAAAMDEQGIDYLFMKGIVLQDLYPQPGMRQMSDNDILYHLHNHPDVGLKGQSQQAMNRLMESMQARTISNAGIVDVYLLNQTSLFEMHREFLGPDQPLYDYFDQTWSRATKVSEESGEYLLKWEDHYILMLAHSHKHFSNSGCGPREIVDAWQFWQVKGSSLDKDYIDHQLKVTGLTEYDAMLRRLGAVIFEAEPATEEDMELLAYFLSSGTYGTKEHAMNNALKKLENEGKNIQQAKTAYLWGRLFPEPEYLQTQFPFFYRHRWLIGFLLLYRGGRALLTKRDSILREWKTFKRVFREKDD